MKNCAYRPRRAGRVVGIDDEGVRLRVYDDATGEPLHPGMTLKGHPSIGYGRALDVNGISLKESKLRDAMIWSRRRMRC